MVRIIFKSGGGGGGIFVPLYILVLGLSSHFAIPLSKVTIFGTAVGGYLVNGFQKHPFLDRPLIYYDISVIMQPPILLGTILGVYLNIIFPEIVLVLALISVLSYASFLALKKSYQIYIKEQNSSNNSQQNDSTSNSERLDVVSHENQENSEQKKVVHSRELQIMLREEANLFPLNKILIFIGIYLSLVFVVLAKGSGSGVSIFGIACGTWQYWMIVILTIPYFSAITYLIGASFMKNHQKRREIGYEYKKGIFVIFFFC